PLNPHRSNTIGPALRWPGSAIAATPPLAVRFQDVEFLLLHQHHTFASPCIHLFVMSGHLESPGVPPMNVLVVEDEPEMASMLIRGLQEELLDVQLAQNGTSALQLSEQNSFDLILLDVMLPDLSGFDVVARLRNRSQDT